MSAIDEMDLKILGAIQLNARFVNLDLAEEVGLSATACWNRVRSLEDRGVITKYVTVINHAAIGYPDIAVVEVALERHDRSVVEEFGTAVTKFPEVIEAYLTDGEYDCFLKIAVDGTAGLDRFLQHTLQEIAGVRHSRARFVLRTLKEAYSVQLTADKEAPRARRSAKLQRAKT